MGKKLTGEKGQISNLIAFSREKFYNHIPQFLEELHNALLDKYDDSEDVASKHGALRWQYGFNLREVTKEWNQLHKILIEHVRLSQQSNPLNSSLHHRAYKIIADSIQTGIMYSINEYYRLQNEQAEAQIRELQATLQEQKQGERDLSQDLRETTHDVQGNLYSLQAGLSILEEDLVNDEKSQVIDQMSLAADGLSDLINNMLDLLRLETGQEKVNLTSFDANAILAELCESLQPLADNENIDLRCNGEDPLMIRGDQSKLQRIVQNLLVNSLKYTQKGYVEMTWELNSTNGWLLSIRDTGPGFNSKETAHLHGEGIGLLIVRKFCKLLDAVLTIESESIDGSIFRIRFPLNRSS